MRPDNEKHVDYVEFTYIDMPVDARRRLGVGDIFLNQGECAKCHWIIRSMNRHHTSTCKCGEVSLDGGSWYQRVSGDQEDFIDHKVMYNETPPTDE